ncbi:MAG: transcriptional repressor [Bacillota bacterium]|nr:transcriptional repressor [Bacillota bacterium]
MGGYQTLQRKALVDFLRQHPGRAFTARDLIKALKEDPFSAQTVGESTVYRLLQKLTAQGLVKRYLLEGSRSYVYEISPVGRSCDGHLHLKCTRCHKLIHLGEEETGRVTREAEKQGFTLDKGQTLLLGQCAACRGELP